MIHASLTSAIYMHFPSPSTYIWLWRLLYATPSRISSKRNHFEKRWIVERVDFSAKGALIARGSYLVSPFPRSPCLSSYFQQWRRLPWYQKVYRKILVRLMDTYVSYRPHCPVAFQHPPLLTLTWVIFPCSASSSQIRWAESNRSASQLANN